MPYVPPSDRRELDPLVASLAERVTALAASSPHEAAFAGLLNYAVTSLALAVLQRRFGKVRYWMLATTSGVLHNAADEFYRRLAGPYEDSQVAKNGDLAGFEALLPESSSEGS